MADPHGGRVPRLFIFGSCISRDAVEYLPDGSVELARYVARQSVISVDHDASGLLPETLDLKHAFQERMVRGDWRGNLWEQIDEAGEFDLLLWDIVDERHGLYWFLNGGVATRSVDALASEPIRKILPGENWIPFGTEEHFEAWKNAVDEFESGLRARGLWDKVSVIRIPWAVRGSDGSLVPPSMGTFAGEANMKYVPYYRYLEELGFDVISVPGPLVADPNHKWGIAPFHYAPEVYDQLTQAILDRLDHAHTE